MCWLFGFFVRQSFSFARTWIEWMGIGIADGMMDAGIRKIVVVGILFCVWAV